MTWHLKIKPISKWIGAETKNPKSSLFKQTYSNTKRLLEDELYYLKAIEASIQIEMFIKAEDLRLDGELRHNAKPTKPGVVLSFSKVKNRVFDKNAQTWKNELLTLSYPCDSYDHWHDNLRAIALSLQNLRAVARYGVFKYEDMVSRLALPSAEGKLSDRDSALHFISIHSGRTIDQLRDKPFLKAGYLEAAMKLHPDKGGSSEDFHKLQEAKRILDI